MKVTYICDCCGVTIDNLEDPRLNEEKLGINTLTPEEREDIIKYDDNNGLIIYSLCDQCGEEMGYDDSRLEYIKPPELH